MEMEESALVSAEMEQEENVLQEASKEEDKKLWEEVCIWGLECVFWFQKETARNVDIFPL